jgi:hypothetical protein
VQRGTLPPARVRYPGLHPPNLEHVPDLRYKSLSNATAANREQQREGEERGEGIFSGSHYLTCKKML